MQDIKYREAKKEIRSVLLTYQSGVSLNEFIKVYQGLIGQSLPTRSLGFTSDIEFLQSMPDVVHISTNDSGKIRLTGIADMASQHIKKLVSRQKAKTNKSKMNACKNSIHSINYNFKQFVPGPVRAEMIKVAIMYPDGITLPSFVLAYAKMFNKYLTLDKGLDTLESMINVIPELEIKIVRNEKKIFFKNIQIKCTLNGAYNTHRKCYSSQVIEGGKSQLFGKASNSVSIHSSGIPYAVQMNFIKVLEKFPEGILSIHFPPLYENVTGEPFDMLDIGYNSLLDLVDALPSIFKRVLDPDNSNFWVILPANSAIKYPSNTTKNNKTAPVNYRKGVPEDAVSALLQFEAPTMPKNINLNDFLPIFVSAIVSPDLFWFQLQLDENIAKFEKLERDIGAFYGSYNSCKYKMHDADIFIGAACIIQCPEDKQWYRAIIKDIPTSDLVNVFFVDYGSRDSINRKTLRYARSKFMDFPARAFRAELAAVKPVGHNAKWNSQSMDRFIELSTYKSLTARLIPIDDDVFSVYLCDSSGDNNIYINDTLVKEGYAELCFENQTSKINSPYEDDDAFSVYLCDSNGDNDIHINDTLVKEGYADLCVKTQTSQNNSPYEDDDAFSVYLCDSSGDTDICTNDTLVKEGYSELCVETQTSKNNSPYELANSELCSGIDGDASLKNEVYATLNSNANAFPSYTSSDSATDIQEQFSLQLGRQPSFDSFNLPVNRKLTCSAENKHFDTEPKACNAPTQYQSRRYIKRIKEFDFIFHIINHENNLLMSAGDVSKLLWKDDAPCCLIQRLMDQEEIIPTITLLTEDCPELFRQGEWYKLVDLNSSDSSLNLYTLENVLKILNTFGHPSLSIKCIIEREIREFDPHNSVWHEFSYEDWEDIEKDIQRENLDSLCILDLKVKFEALKMKRLMLLNANSGMFIKEIKRIESLSYVIQRKIEYIKALWLED